MSVEDGGRVGDGVEFKYSQFSHPYPQITLCPGHEGGSQPWGS